MASNSLNHEGVDHVAQQDDGEGRNVACTGTTVTGVPTFPEDSFVTVGTSSAGSYRGRDPSEYEDSDRSPDNEVRSSSLEQKLRLEIAALRAENSSLRSRQARQRSSPVRFDHSYSLPNDRNQNRTDESPSRSRADRNGRRMYETNPFSNAHSRSNSPGYYFSENVPNSRYRQGHFENGNNNFLMDSRNFRNQRPTAFCKVAPFDGSEGIDDYLIQFEITAEGNCWGSQTMARKLSTRLRGPAISALYDMSIADRNNYAHIVSKLRARFQPGEQTAMAREKLQQRLRKSSESLVELGDKIKRLSRKAYPCIPEDVPEELAVNHFLDSINDASLRAFIEVREPKSVDEAVRAALKSEKTLDSRHNSRFARLIQPEHESGNDIAHFQGKFQEHDQKLDQILCKLRDINVSNQDASKRSQFSTHGDRHTIGQTNRPSNNRSHTTAKSGKFPETRICFHCNIQGHIAKNCPSKFGNNNNQSRTDASNRGN